MSKINKKINGIFLYLGLLLISISLLGLELLFVRVAKVSFGESFQFILISLAILGIGVGAMLVYFFINFKWYKKRHTKKFIITAIFASALFYAILILTPFFVINNLVIDFEASRNYATNVLPAAKLFFFLTTFILYISWGVCVSLIFSYYSKSISLLYFSNLMGSALGGIVAIISMNILGVPKTVSLIYTLTFIAVIFLALHANMKIRHIAVISLLLVLYMYFLPDINLICGTKHKNLFSETNSFSQIDTYKIEPIAVLGYWETDYDFTQSSGNISLYRMTIDCIGRTDLVEYDKKQNLEFLLHDPRVIPYLFRNYSRVLIIGSGAGIDVVRAVLMNAKIVDAVEINPLIIKRVDKLVKSESNIYNQENVNLYIEEARNFIAKSNNIYDFIYIPGAKRYGGASIALYAFLENYLFTEEAFESYFNHLTEDGVLAITDPQWFILRYLETGISAMKKLGINPKNKIALVSGDRSLLIFKKSDFTEQEKMTINDAAIRFKSNSNINDGKVYLKENYPKITDDHPFFWIINIPKNFRENVIDLEEFSSPQRDNFPSLNKYYILFLFILLVYIIFIVAPLLLNKSNINSISILKLLLYFSALGIGFIIIELILMQKFVLLLGHPIYSMAVVLSSLLFFSSLGSLFTERFVSQRYNIIRAIVFIVFIIGIYIIVFKPLISITLHMSLITKIIFSTTLMALPSFFMGMLFPLGIKITEKLYKSLIPWMWGINGIASTLGGVMSMIISLLFGFNAALIVGLIIYGLGAFAILGVKEL